MGRIDWVYLMRNMRNGYTKIGCSHDPEFREKTLQSEEPEVELLAVTPGGYALECHLHARFRENRLRGEWFDLSREDYRTLIENYGLQLTRDDIFNSIILGVSVEQAERILLGVEPCPA